MLLVAFNAREGFKTVAKNEATDVKQEEFTAEVSRERALIAAGLGQNENRQRAYLDSSIRSRPVTDRAFLIAALENDSISPGILDTLANSNDLNIALQAVRNPVLDCALLEQAARNVAATPRDDTSDAADAQLEELRPEVCAKPALAPAPKPPPHATKPPRKKARG